MTFIEARDYDISKLGDRKIAIPDAEPKLDTSIRHIPVCEPDLSPKAKAYINDALDSNWISSRGRYLDRFEREFADKVGAKYAVAVNSGTNALYLAVATLGLDRYSKVVMPSFTMISTAFAVSYLGHTPIFVDSDEYYQMSVEETERVIKENLFTDNPVKLIMPVHIYGHPVDIDEFERLGRKYDIPVIYDSAEAHGSEYKGKPIGNRGFATCYSFYANKIITTGEGGMVVSDNQEYIDLCRNLKDVAFSDERHFWHKRLGYNFRMTNLCAAIGVSQVEDFDYLVQQHIDHAEYYMSQLKDVKGLKFAPTADYAKNVYWMFGLEVDEKEFGMNRDQLREFLAQNGIETRTFFVPLHLQPYYSIGRKETYYPIAERLSARGLYLPSSSKLTYGELDTVCEFVKKAHVQQRG